MKNNNVSVGVYCRLSEEDKDKSSPEEDSESIKNQQLMLTKYATEQGWKIYDIYIDDDWTGADRSRPEFNRLINDAREGRINIVLCKTQSRFTREIEIVEKYLHNLFPSWGVRFISLVDNADTAVKENKKSRQINGLINEWYLEDMSENIKAVLAAKRVEGYYVGNIPLYGYKKDPERKGHLIIDSEAAEVVRFIFTSYADGMGKTPIARMLNEKGIPNPTQYKLLNGLSNSTPSHKSGTLWKYYTISSILSNQMYIGNMVQGRYASTSYKTHKNKPTSKENWIIVENTHEPIIDKDLWDKTQMLVRTKARPYVGGEIGIFAKKVRCAKCGYLMTNMKHDGNHYLRCGTRKIHKDSCPGAFISTKKLEKIVLQEINKINEDYLDQDEIEKELVINRNIKERVDNLEHKKNTLNKKIEQLDKAFKNLYIDKINEDITQKQFEILSKELTDDKMKKTDELECINKDVERCRELMASEINKKQLIQQYVNIDTLTRPITDVLIDYIEVDSSNKAQTEVKIYWKF